MKTLSQHLSRLGIQDPDVLAAFEMVPREAFVEPRFRAVAYEDEALPISCGQTISQPYIVARMTEAALAGQRAQKVLEIGTGSGYQAAILAQCVSQVYTIERYQLLADQAKQRFKALGYTHIHVRHGDGYLGWEEAAPFDAVVVTAAAETIPPALLAQLREDGGRLVMPVGSTFETQALVLVTRAGDQFQREVIDSVVFVPLVPGKAQE